MLKWWRSWGKNFLCSFSLLLNHVKSNLRLHRILNGLLHNHGFKGYIFICFSVDRIPPQVALWLWRCCNLVRRGHVNAECTNGVVKSEIVCYFCGEASKKNLHVVHLAAVQLRLGLKSLAWIWIVASFEEMNLERRLWLATRSHSSSLMSAPQS